MGTTELTRIKRRVLLSALTILWAILVPGAINSDTRLQFSSGYVAAVSVVVDEQGHPMLAEYDSNGKFVADVGYLGIGELENVVLYPAASWRAFQQLQRTLESENPELVRGARLISAEDYDALNFQTRSGQPVAEAYKPDLLPGTQSVFVISEDKMLNPEPTREGFILAEYPVALHEDPALEESDLTLILNEQGIVVRKSSFDISYKVAVYRDDAARNEKDGTRLLWKPLSAVLVSTGPHDMPVYPGGIGTSREDGRYSMTYALPPCPGFAIEHRVPVVATINIENFNPKSEDLGFVTSMQYDYKWCVGYGDVSLGVTPSALNAQLNARAVVATLATPIYDLNIIFSSMQLNAIGKLTNEVVEDFAELDDQTLELGPVALSGQTVYAEDAAPQLFDEADYVDRFDFNLDGVKDIAIQNEDDPNQVDVYISPNRPSNEAGEEQPPDFTRRADYLLESQLSHQGLLTEINTEDLEDTDVYIYRRSTNQLLGAIEGLVEEQEIDGPVQSQGNDKGRLTYRGVHTEEDFATFGFTSFLIGAVSGDTFSNLRSRVTSADPARRRPWQTSEDRAADFGADNPPDALRPGETVQVIAINRTSGYIGTQEVVIQPSGTTLEPPEPIRMGPPNLKVIAKREFRDFDELTGEEKDRINIIGSEGAGLTSDTYVTIQTIWLDHDGDALPEDLPGYTGRLAISTGNSTRAYNPSGSETGANSDFAGNFEIKPGYQTQVVQLNNASDPSREHFYVQVVGEDIHGNAADKFGSPSESSGRLQTRPGKYVPVLVPLFDEESTRKAEEALALARFQGIENLPERVEPIYRWVYRPEMQFSTYELLSPKLALHYLDETIQVIDLTNTSSEDYLNDLLADNIDYVEFIADLFDPDPQSLSLFGPDKQLIVALGAEEAEVNFNTGGVIRFDNPKHIGLLSPEALTSVRLYLNNDSANLLWDLETTNIELAVDLNRDGYLDFVGGLGPLLQEDGEPNDLTTPDRPFRFWVNNDYDVVSNEGSPQNGPCVDAPQVVGGQVRQICEEWDQRVINERTNTSTLDMPDSNKTHLERIDNYRDLEDFVPLKVRLTMDRTDPDIRIEIEGKGVSVNLFKGKWLDNRETEVRAHRYIFDESATKEQYDEGNKDEGGYLGYAGAGQPAIVIGPEDYELWFDEKGVGRFLMEGVEPTSEDCVNSFVDCYLQFRIYSNNEVLRERRLYLDFNDVKDYYQEYTAGSVIDNNPNSTDTFQAEYNGGAVVETNPKKLDIYQGLYMGEDTKHYSLLVHGWRMREVEKEQFADTSFKRLYWTGYRGTMGTMKWPTGWFNKPAHVYAPLVLAFVIPNTQHYGTSEAVARRVGAELANELPAIKSSYTNFHVFAHSMGNVVVSEALRHGNENLMDTYIAMEAAEVGGSYDQGLADVRHKMLLVRDPECYFLNDTLIAEEAWRCYNVDNLFAELFDMPPDKYRYDIPLEHGPTSTDYITAQNSTEGPRGGKHYFTGIKGKAGKIVSFHNANDTALSAWEFNQLTKPDNDNLVGDTREWEYEYVPVTCTGLIETCDVGDTVADRFFEQTMFLGQPVPFTKDYFTYRENRPIDEDTAQIIGHILPARTRALGQLELRSGEENIDEDDDQINGRLNLRAETSEIFATVPLEFTNSNQDHSAQFHGYISEDRPLDGQVRLLFWENMILEDGINIEKRSLSELGRLPQEKN